MRNTGYLASLLALLVACGGSAGGPTPNEAQTPADQSARLQDTPAPQDAGAALTALPAGEWSEAIRQHRWADAARLMDAMTVAEQQRPELRFARARVALALADHAKVLTLLDELENKLPLLGREIEADRAEAQLVVGPFEPAARYFERDGSAGSLIKAARAWLGADKLKEAGSAADRAVGLSTSTAKKKQKRTAPSSLEIQARSVRASVAEKQGDKALAAVDLRWLATFAPTSDGNKDADERLEQVEPKRALTARERYERAMAMAREGRVEQLEREIDLIQRASGPRVSKAELLHARGWANYQARNWLKAAELLEQSSNLGGENAAHDLFHAARALSRAHQDDRAIAKYAEVVRLFPNSPWASQAGFLSARLLYTNGRFRKAADAYTSYSRKAKKSPHAGRARYEQAVSWLASGQNQKAAKLLTQLADAEKDDLDRVSLVELQGIALAAAGKKGDAAKAFRRVIDERPLSFQALAASTRLSALGESQPPLIEPAKSAPIRPTLAIELPAKVRLLKNLGLDGDAESSLMDAEESIRRSYAPRGDEALCKMYGELGEAARRYRVGQNVARPEELNRAPAADTRWLWECVYPTPYEELVRAAEKQWSLPTNFVYAVMRQESAFNPRVVSPAKAVGLLQLIPPTAESAAQELELAFEPLLLASPAYNIRIGTFYLQKVLSTFGGNLALAAAAYNAGPTAVTRWLESGEQLPLDVFVARIPYEETRNYVARVVGNYARYAYLTGGDTAVPKLELEIPKGLRAKPDAY